ncbi:MAG: BNR-4 repeat-containing protein [Phycisphaeraceae bacterium]
MQRPGDLCAISTLVLLILSSPSPASQPMLTGFSGIWYALGDSGPHGYKYSGGTATYPQQHSPIAEYAGEVDQTFFVYGSASHDGLVSAISSFDHRTGLVSRPRALTTVGGDNAHNNPSLAIRNDGRLLVADNAHGNSRPSSFLLSDEPWSIDSFTTTLTLPAGPASFSYGNPYYVDGQGFIFLHTEYDTPADGFERNLYWNTSADGVAWDHKWNLAVFPDTSRPQLANIEKGQYQMTWQHSDVIGTALNIHPAAGGNGRGSDARTNLYYLQTPDAGQSWTLADGTPVAIPLTEASNAALVRDYNSLGLNVYLKQTTFDSQGRPVLVYLTADDYSPGPDRFDRTLHTARWNGSDWEIREVVSTDHNYDHGSLIIEPVEDGGERWSILGPYLDGPVPWRTGGALGYWQSTDRGETWELIRAPLPDPSTHHSYVRPVLRGKDRFAFFWADGDPDTLSTSHLYFANSQATRVYRLPTDMTMDHALPELVWFDPQHPVIPGDLNGDDLIDALDIDVFTYAIGLTQGDLDADGVISDSDLDHLILTFLGTSYGDANLDRRVDLIDLSLLASHFGASGGWAEGDFDRSGFIDLADLSTLATHFGFDATAIPEPCIPAFALATVLWMRCGGRLSSH